MRSRNQCSIWVEPIQKLRGTLEDVKRQTFIAYSKRLNVYSAGSVIAYIEQNTGTLGDILLSYPGYYWLQPQPLSDLLSIAIEFESVVEGDNILQWDLLDIVPN